MDPSIGELIKLLLTALAGAASAFTAAVQVSRRQVKKVKDEHAQKEIILDTRWTELNAQIIILKSEWQNLAEARGKEINGLEKELDETQGKFIQVQTDSTSAINKMSTAFDGLTLALNTLNASNQALLLELKELRSNLTAEGAKNREHYTSNLAEQLAPITKGASTVSEDMRQLKQAMDERATANGEAFTALQTGLNNLKAEVIALATATGREHDKTRKDLLTKIDALTRIVTDMAKAPQGSEKSTQIENSAPAENVSTSKEPPSPAKLAPKELKEGI